MSWCMGLRWQGVHECKVARGAPSVSNLLFADNCYFFFPGQYKWRLLAWRLFYTNMKWCLANLSIIRTDIVFSPNTCSEDRTLVCDCLGVKQVDKPRKYLGMPMCVGKSKQEVFGFLSDWIQSKLQGWWNKELSRSGKLMLLKSAAQTIPNFWMSLFLIPVSLCDEIEGKIKAFLWSTGSNGSGFKWITWKRLCVPKEYGGLGWKN